MHERAEVRVVPLLILASTRGVRPSIRRIALLLSGLLLSELLLSGLLLTSSGSAQQLSEDIRQLKLRDWQPKSMLVTQETQIQKPAVPAVDVHNHLGAGTEHLHELASISICAR